MARTKKSVQEKVQQEYPEFVTEVVGLSEDQLNGRLATLAKNLEESENAKEADEELADAQILASELSGPYKDAKKALRLKSKYVISLLRDKGAA
jgi:hypothetical protein